MNIAHVTSTAETDGRKAAQHLYVHVPFCSRKCSYCDFAIAVRRIVPVEQFVAAIERELRVRAEESPAGPLKTLYLGGGTPSKLGSKGVSQLLTGLRERCGLALVKGAEVTLEANPEDVTHEEVTAWLAAGVTRLSMGVQSFDDAALTWMHRTHDAAAARAAIVTARAAGADHISISLDLIFGLPSALNRSWEADLDRALELGPDHLSVYGLTVEERTPLGRWTARGEVLAAPDDRYAFEFLLAHARLAAAGFEHYEVSNFAREGRRSAHNSSYWRRVPYLGVGPSAHSFDGSRRRWNAREYEAWKVCAVRGDDPIEGSELLSFENVAAEQVYLGLRTVEGLATVPEDEKVVRTWEAQGWADVSAGRVRLSAEGWLRLDSLSAALTAARSR